MRSHLRAVVCVGFLSIASSAYAQEYAHYASGSTSLRATFDPLAPPVPPRIPVVSSGTITIPRLPVIPPDQYQKQKSLPPRTPAGPPGTTWFSPSGDPVQVPARLPLALTPSLSFEGIQQTIYQPPSPNIAAGPEDIIQVVNSTIARYTRDGVQTNQVNLTQWFNTGNLFPVICNSLTSCIFGDVSIHYDQLHGRFILSLQVLDLPSTTSYLLLSVSSGATYASGWTNWALSERLDGDAITNNWADFPQLGYDNVAIYVTTNQFSLTTFTFQYAKVRIIKKSDLYNPATTLLFYKDIFGLKNADGSFASTLQAPILRGRTQVGTANGLLINASDATSATYLTLWKIAGPATNNPAATPVTLNNVWAYGYPASAPQLGTTVPLDTGPSSFNRTILRDGILYGAQNVGYVDQPTTVTYSLVDVTQNKVTLQQRWLNGNFFYPAFDIPASIGPGNTLPNNLIVGTTTSSTGALTYAGITGIKDGESFYDSLAGGTAARWGDYFGGTVDPVTGGMWVSGEYAKARVNDASRWGTWNAHLPWSTGQIFADVDPASPNFDYINVMRLWNVTKGCGATTPLFCPKATVSRAALAVFIIRSIYGDNFTYPPTPYFADVPATDPNFPYIQKMMEQGITKGCSLSPVNYCPDDIATRSTAAVFIIRAKLSGLFGDNFTFPATPYFTDVASGDANFNFIQKFREFGYTNGCSPTGFCPDMQLTREMVAVFIVRAFFN